MLDNELPESIRVPRSSDWFKNVALRDLALQETHAACIDARGDVYQWGDGFSGSEPGSSHARPQLTLKGKVRDPVGELCTVHVNLSSFPSLPSSFYADRTSSNCNSRHPACMLCQLLAAYSSSLRDRPTRLLRQVRRLLQAHHGGAPAGCGARKSRSTSPKSPRTRNSSEEKGKHASSPLRLVAAHEIHADALETPDSFKSRPA